MNSFSKFLEDYPTYSATSTLNDLRATEFARLDGRGHVYLDYTGAGLYTASQLCWHTEMLVMHVLGNPHSASLSSTEMTRQVEHTRASILKYFNGTDNYTAVFTLKCVRCNKTDHRSLSLWGRRTVAVEYGQPQFCTRHSQIR
jgi:selenocysteine lyase/cysteine desulfurase